MNGATHWHSHFLKGKMKRNHQFTKFMAKEMKKEMSRIIGHKKRKKKMIMRIGVALIIVIQIAHLVKRTTLPNNKFNNKDVSPHARKGKLAI